MTEKDRQAIADMVLKAIPSPPEKEEEPWLQKNWLSLLLLAANIAGGFLLVGRKDANLDQLSHNFEAMTQTVNAIRESMVQKETINVKFEEMQSTISHVADNQKKTDDNVADIQRRFMNEYHGK